jgi:hypothetical protein
MHKLYEVKPTDETRVIEEVQADNQMWYRVMDMPYCLAGCPIRKILERKYKVVIFGQIAEVWAFEKVVTTDH